MNRDELIESWLAGGAGALQPGGTFRISRVGSRVSGSPGRTLDRAAELMGRSSSVIDMETGGGEKFSSLREHWPARVVATEGYDPNFKLAKERLSPLGAEVVKIGDSYKEPMPFADGEFDLVLNRHGDFMPREVARVLSPRGTFLTQQVHGMWLWDLQAAFGATPAVARTPRQRTYVPLLEAAGLTQSLNVEKWEGRMVFEDVGAIVYYLKAIPWEVPEFTVEVASSLLARASGAG